ncbi:MAG: tRNA preQ1(34) S-adenosylmethionine ribosyltransferase-isomerase QueA [Smithellaceae bacterium]|nr:tRNA preQ1(34) S-adenosylmethionine ribosyltransferase-isomerase QueA [Smithellaceae bacterium]
MKLKDFDYDLPAELIAQQPCEQRDRARMMVVKRDTGAIEHRGFFDLPFFLKKGDCLVINNSRVIPARLIAKKATGGLVEILLLHKAGSDTLWEALLRPGKRVTEGLVLTIGERGQARIVERISDKKWLVSFEVDGAFDAFLEKYGLAPLPPYIKRARDNGLTAGDRERYQTIYAREPGSVAAPTAGLHFSPEVLNDIQAVGIDIAPVTLHVGYGTFVPVETENVEDHVMEEEFFEISPAAARLINEAERVIAVGTTSTRVLEAAADEEGRIRAGSASTGIYIYPGYRFKRVDTLLTNFHLPRSSLLLLASAFAGSDLLQKAYAEAVAARYRFYSYGDCMLIV